MAQWHGVIAARETTISIKSLKLPDAGATIEIPPRRAADVIAAITSAHRARSALCPARANPTLAVSDALVASSFPRH